MMRIKFIYLLATAFVFANCACEGPQVPGQNEQVDAPRVTKLTNAGFELGFEGWEISGDKAAAKVSDKACHGAKSASLAADAAADVVLTKSVDNFEDGLYDLTFYYKRSKSGIGACYVGTGADVTNLRLTALECSEDVWKVGRVRGIEVRDGNLTVQIRCETEVSGALCLIDGLSFEKADEKFELLKGGDISELTLVEQEGGKYYWDGKEMDCVKLLKEGGFNIVRLRLYNDPGNPGHYPSNILPAGIQDEEDILRLARRAKEEGMQIQMTFHYSDSWTNGNDQYLPHEWKDMTFPQLKTAVYDYTKDFLQRMKDQGTEPEYVSLGNETQAGMLYPFGSVKNMSQLCDLYNAGAKAVRHTSPDAKIIIHSDGGGDLGKYSWYFGEMKKYSVDYDIIGASYYPFWTNLAVSSIIPWAKTVTEMFGKPIILMECGYAWNKTLPNGYPGQLSHNGPYNDMTKLGQKNFMLEVFGQIKANPEANILGVLYWDPIFIEAGDAGWAVSGDNVVSNTTLFDFNGNALEVFDAFKYNN